MDLIGIRCLRMRQGPRSGLFSAWDDQSLAPLLNPSIALPSVDQAEFQAVDGDLWQESQRF
jgi:hypothetical protein